MPPYEKLKVKKIITTNLADIDAQNLFYIRDLSLVSFKSSLSMQVGIDVWLQKPFHADSFKKDMQEFLNKDESLLIKDWRVDTWMDRNSALFYALKLEKLMIGIFLGLAGLVSSFSIITVLALLISEKTRDIAMLRTLGLSHKNTIKIFIQMGMLISAVGLFIGAFLGSYIPTRALEQITPSQALRQKN